MKLEITKEELEIDTEIIRKVDVACSFCKAKAKYINGSIRKVSKTNLMYIEPHRVIINNLVFLVFNNSNNLFLGNLSNQYEFKDLKRILKGEKSDVIL